MSAGPWSDGPAMLPRIPAPRTVTQQPPGSEQPRATARTPPGRPEPAAFTYSSIRGLPMRFLRSAFMLGICLASPLLALGASAQSGPPPAAARDRGQPVVKEIVELDDFIGRFEAVDQVDVRARVSGYVDKVHFHRRRDRQGRRPALHHRSEPYEAALEEAQATVNVGQGAAGTSPSERSAARRGAAPDRKHRRADVRSAPGGLSYRQGRVDRDEAAFARRQARPGIHARSGRRSAGAHVAPARFRRQSGQRQRNDAGQHRLARPHLFLLRRR